MGLENFDNGDPFCFGTPFYRRNYHVMDSCKNQFFNMLDISKSLVRLVIVNVCARLLHDSNQESSEPSRKEPAGDAIDHAMKFVVRYESNG